MHSFQVCCSKALFFAPIILLSLSLSLSLSLWAICFLTKLMNQKISIRWLCFGCILMHFHDDYVNWYAFYVLLSFILKGWKHLRLIDSRYWGKISIKCFAYIKNRNKFCDIQRNTSHWAVINKKKITTYMKIFLQKVNWQ